MSRGLGPEGEARAEGLLSGLGYRLLERGYRRRVGEIDLIMRDGETVVFVEVKARSSSRFASPEAAVGARKRERVVKTALAYLRAKGLRGVSLRFDVVAVEGSDIRHYPHAFQAPRRYVF